MAMTPNPGLKFDVGGRVDPTFLAGVAQAKESTAKASTEGRNWGSTLKALGSALGGAAQFVGTLAVEQKIHNANVAASVKAAGDQMAAYQKLQSQALAPLAQSLQSLVALQEKQLAVMAKGATVAPQAVQANTTMATSVKSLGGAVEESSIHFDTIRYAAQSAFGGDLMGAVQTLGGHLANFSGILIGVTAAVTAANTAMTFYENVQKATGKAIEDESHRLAKATQAWREYGGAIAHVSGKGQGFLAGMGHAGSRTPKELLDNLGSIRNTVQGLAPIDAYSEFEQGVSGKSDPVQAKVAADLAAATDAKNRIMPVVSKLKSLRGKGVISTADQDAEGVFSALGKSDTYQFAKQSGGNVPLKIKPEELEQAIRQQQKLYEQFSQSATAVEEYKKKIDRVADGIDYMATKKDKINEVTAAFKGLGTREGLVSAQSYTKEAFAEMQHKYSGVTGGKKTDTESLTQVLTGSGSKVERDLAKHILETRKTLSEQGKAIDDYDIEVGRKKVKILEEELALRKSLGKSSGQDVADTLKAELEALSPKDSAGRSGLLNKQTEEHGKWLSENLKDYVSDDVEAYKLLQSTGTATAAQLDTANKKITKSVKDWVAAQGEVLEQYPKIRQEADALANSAKQEGNRIRAKAFDEHYSDLKGKIAKDDNSALNTREKMSANQRSVASTNAALNSGLITQKQHTEELATLEKERANLQRTITTEMEAQKKAVEAQKTTLARERLTRFTGAVSRGEGGAFASDKKEQLTKEVLGAELRAIDDEYQAAIKAGKDQTMAAEEASLKKKRLWESETEKFRAEQDAQTNAQKQADKDRVGGSASPLVGLNEGAAFSGLKFSGFKSFGEGFGKFAQRRTAFDDFQATQLPDNINSMFKQQQTYERPAAKAGGDTYHVHVDPQWVNPATQQLLEQVGRAMGEAASRRALRVGPGAPSMTRDSVAQ